MIIEEKSFHLMSTPVQRTIYDECVFHMPVVKKSHDPTPSLRVKNTNVIRRYICTYTTQNRKKIEIPVHCC